MGTIAVVGTGYVGVTAAACFAHLGHRVVGADVDSKKVSRLRAGRSPFLEEGLDELLRAGLASGRLSFVASAAEAVRGCEFAFLCLPTPGTADGSPDLSFVDGAVAEIAPILPAGSVVVCKSTVPVGTCRRVRGLLRRDDIGVVSNPEFLREGSAVRDFLEPDRIVVGADEPPAAAAVAGLYGRLGAPVLITDPESAELVKYTSNAFLATKVAFINSVARLCEELGGNIDDVARGMGLDPRIGPRFLAPGPGWGGSCFPKDTRALLTMAHRAGAPFEILRGALAVNEQQAGFVAAKVTTAVGGNLAGIRVAVWGLTFKAGTDDLRNSPALAVVRRLLADGAVCVAYDPAVIVPPAGVVLAGNPYSACIDADVVVLLTEWPEFRDASLHKVKELVRRPVVVDARNVLDASGARSLGFEYHGLGRRGCVSEPASRR